MQDLLEEMLWTGCSQERSCGLTADGDIGGTAFERNACVQYAGAGSCGTQGVAGDTGVSPRRHGEHGYLLDSRI